MVDAYVVREVKQPIQQELSPPSVNSLFLAVQSKISLWADGLASLVWFIAFGKNVKLKDSSVSPQIAIGLQYKGVRSEGSWRGFVSM